LYSYIYVALKNKSDKNKTKTSSFLDTMALIRTKSQIHVDGNYTQGLKSDRK